MPTLRRTLLPLVAPAFLAACNGSKDTGGEPPIPDGRDTDSAGDLECGGIPPEILTFTATADGLYEFEQGITQPALKISITARDDDQDLHEVNYEIWLDAHLDNTVDTSHDPYFDRLMTISTENCLTPTATVNLRLGAQAGSELEPNTWYDFAARVSDANGEPSEVVFTTGGTPKEDGSEPDPMEP